MAVKIVILSIGFFPNIGGLETHLTDLSNELSKKYEVLVVTLPPITTQVQAPTSEQKGQLTIWRVPWFGKGLFYKFMPYPILNFLYLTPPLFVGLLVALIRYPSIEVIHAQGLSGLLTGAILGKIFGKRIVVSTHYIYDFKDNYFSKFAIWTYSLADRILCVAKASRQEMEDAGINKTKLGRCAYWINLQMFKPQNKAAAKKKLKWPNKFSVFFIGRFVEMKGIVPLLKSIPLLPPEVQMYIAGDGPLKDDVVAASQKHSNLHFLGKIDNLDTPNYFNAADVVVVPSLQETLGRVSMESLACATPVVVSSTDGTREVVNDKVGILIEPTPEQISAAIIRLYQDKTLYASLQKNARAHIQKYYSEKNVEEFIKEYALGKN